jgi:imidazolonepropionase-like amidohydrolase
MHEELKKLEDAVIDCFMVPKEWLPEAFQGKRSHRSLKSVVKEAQKRGLLETEHQELKRIKAEKIAKYSAEFAEKGSFTYEENADKVYRNQMTFCTLMGVELDEE